MSHQSVSSKVSSLVYLNLRKDTMQLWELFWSLNIVILDLFVI